MEHLIYVAILAGCVGLSYFLWNHEHKVVRKIAREKEEIETEEHRMFDFLHGLGEALIEDSSPPNMHRYIVEGVTNVVEANAGILYLLDNETDRVVPVSQSPETAPVLPLPTELRGIEFEDKTLQQYRSFIRLSPLNRHEGLIGEALSEGKVFAVEDLSEYFGEKSSQIFHQGVSALAGPLIYANKQIGVLAVTGRKSFSSNDHDVFASIIEQSSFALGSAIIHAEAVEKKRLDRELAQASEIQRILLPRKNPALSDFRLAAFYRAARHLSGDYYDYLRVDDDHYGVGIADVCGKGIAASLIMAMCRSSLRSSSPDNLSPSSVLHQVNSLIYPDIREDMFVSFLYLILERSSGVINVANAGHEPPLIRRDGSRSIEEPEIPGLAVGVDKGAVFNRVVKNHQITLEKGDVLLLFTDGLIEAVNRKGEEFGLERFRETFRETPGNSAEEVVQSITSKVAEFTAGTNAIDDITLIAIEKR